jgi:beta-glucosidase
MTSSAFPMDFVWGVATSSFQIEGDWDGKGESSWDRFAHTPGKREDESTGDKACNHYYSWPEDVSLMHSMGINAYRFSVSWPRVLPEGKGIVGQAGIPLKGYFA